MPSEPHPDNEQESDFLSPPERTSAGPVLAILLILALLIVGAFYFFQRHRNETTMRNQIPYIPSGTTTIILRQE
ncbi:hypothetical protein A2704_03720 [Candidatus Kaiserbacteria bacterium RIFCSPHIGHO2_01_FULL_54_36b]|uniref:Uncharacterized protein n=1 Tax=Candidatus Kaiserbacteria bacterium RIFCSPHIGHO2_01_FULL_54_36b TaxID=1798483 RepID=A0A1F6CK30_9BACT|nr:MAG: hypothetical protein A2704_03720 [Candidatus Kaiserbacteria bacterium RIFCSPHIGHO2_01_FULL_54_36b]